eukprot:scaffold58946_cov63-Phaeocystis_antarctica.AAC.9
MAPGRTRRREWGLGTRASRRMTPWLLWKSLGLGLLASARAPLWRSLGSQIPADRVCATA